MDQALEIFEWFVRDSEAKLLWLVNDERTDAVNVKTICFEDGSKIEGTYEFFYSREAVSPVYSGKQARSVIISEDGSGEEQELTSIRRIEMEPAVFEKMTGIRKIVQDRFFVSGDSAQFCLRPFAVKQGNKIPIIPFESLPSDEQAEMMEFLRKRVEERASVTAVVDTAQAEQYSESADEDIAEPGDSPDLLRGMKRTPHTPPTSPASARQSKMPKEEVTLPMLGEDAFISPPPSPTKHRPKDRGSSGIPGTPVKPYGRAPMRSTAISPEGTHAPGHFPALDVFRPLERVLFPEAEETKPGLSEPVDLSDSEKE